MEKSDRLALAPQVKEYLAEILTEINKELLRMLSESPELAVKAHYEYLAMNRIALKIQGDIALGVRSERESK